MDNIKAGVVKAAEMLDEMAATGNHQWLVDWHDKVDIDNLYMSSTVSDVLGQLDGDYGSGRAKLDAAYGRSNVPNVFGDFEADWIAVIKARRDSGVAKGSLWAWKSGSFTSAASALKVLDVLTEDNVRVVAYKWIDSGDFSIRTLESFRASFKPFMEPFKHGDVLQDETGKIYLVGRGGKVWAISEYGGLRYTKDAEKIGKLKPVKRAMTGDGQFNIITTDV